MRVHITTAVFGSAALACLAGGFAESAESAARSWWMIVAVALLGACTVTALNATLDGELGSNWLVRVLAAFAIGSFGTAGTLVLVDMRTGLFLTCAVVNFIASFCLGLIGNQWVPDSPEAPGPPKRPR